MRSVPLVRPLVARLAVAHLVNDMNQSAVLGLVPFLVASRGLGYSAASGLVAASMLSSAVVQPLPGHLSDGRPLRRVVPVTLLMGAAALALVGFASGIGLAAAVFLVGAATAAFHPESARAARDAGGASAVSVYALGGNVGTAAGPVAAALVVTVLGWPGLALLVAPAALAAGLIGGTSSSVVVPAAAPRARRGDAAWRLFGRLVAILVLRGAFSACVTTFVPLYLVHMGVRPATASLTLTLMLLAGVAAALAVGRLADRRARPILCGALAPLGPLVVLFLAVPAGGAIAWACLLLVGAGSMAPYAVAVVAAQDCLPGRAGLAAGIAMGVASALGSAALPVFGILADAVGLAATLATAAALPVLATVLAVPAPFSTRCEAARHAAGARREDGRPPAGG